MTVDPWRSATEAVYRTGYADGVGATEARIAALATALRAIGQAAAEGADALAMHKDDILDAMGRFEAITDAVLTALREDLHDG